MIISETIMGKRINERLESCQLFSFDCFILLLLLLLLSLFSSSFSFHFHFFPVDFDRILPLSNIKNNNNNNGWKEKLLVLFRIPKTNPLLQDLLQQPCVSKCGYR